MFVFPTIHKKSVFEEKDFHPIGAVDRKVPEHKSTSKSISPRLAKWGCHLILHFYPVGQFTALKKHLYLMYRLSAQFFVYGLYITIRQHPAKFGGNTHTSSGKRNT